MKKLVTVLLSSFIIFCTYGLGNTMSIEYRLTGMLDAMFSDPPGLDGAAFESIITVNTAPESWGTKTGPTDFYYAFYYGTGSLSLTGTAGGVYDGTYNGLGGSILLRRGNEMSPTVYGIDYLEAGLSDIGLDANYTLDFGYMLISDTDAWFPGVDPMQLPTTFPTITSVNSGIFVDDDDLGIDYYYDLVQFEYTATIVQDPIPEPATMLLLGSGLVGFGVIGRKKFLKK